MAVAFLTVVAVAAVMLLTGGNPAQADTASLTPGNGGGHLAPAPQDGPGGNPTPEPTAEPTPEPHATPEPCPGDEDNLFTEAADAVSAGHIALFDVYWNDEDEEELTLNPCPPTVVHGQQEDVRTSSNINIEKTVIHVPNTALVNLSATNYPRSKYPGVWNADALENRDTTGDGIGDGAGDKKVWVLPACPDGAPADNGLCIGFSADLLNPADWGDLDNTVKGDGKVEFHIDHVHQLDTGGQGRRYVLAYDVPGPSASAPYAPVIDSSNANHGGVEVTPGEYEHPIWFFTRSGKYEFQMHVTGHPEREPAGNRSAVSPDAAVSSDVREYLVHVGLMADLSVDVSVAPTDSSDTSLDPGDSVTITITAKNAGPDAAPDTKVDVTLPDGLTYSSHDPNTDTFADSDGDGIQTWQVGNLAKDASKTLTITATVADGTRGKEQTVTAHIFAIETFSSEEALELDPDTENNTRTATVTPLSIPNTDPSVSIMCFVNEFSKPGTKVCDPVKVKDPDNTNDTLTYGLIGDGSEHFVAKHIEGGVQIEVAPGASIEYATRRSYTLNLTVSDGKDAHGNNDPSVDETVHVTIDVRDFIVNLSADNLTPTAGENVTFTVELVNNPVPVSELSFYWGNRAAGETEDFEGYGDWGNFETSNNTATQTVRSDEAASLEYRIEFFYVDGGVEKGTTYSDIVTVTWSASGN